MTYKKITWFIALIFLISLLPIFYCTFFDYANGDDLWEGAAAYRVLVNNGTMKEFFTEIFNWAKKDYIGWEGNWSSIILWCLEPSIWGEKVYCITPWIGLFSLCGGSTYFLFHYLKKYLTDNKVFLWLVSLIVCFFTVQYMPNIRSGVFWYTGMVNYILPYGLCLASFVWIDKFVETGKKRYFFLATLYFAYLGGAGYTTIVLAFEVLTLIISGHMFKRENKRLSRVLWLLVPFFLLMAGFIFSALSPGNAVRGGDSYYFSVSRVFFTIVESIWQGFKGAINWFITVRPLFLTVPLLFIAVWEQIDITKIKWEFKHPVLVLVFLFLVSCSLYAPGIYAQSEVSGGVPDTIWFVFLLMFILGIIYLTCYIKKLVKTPYSFEKLRTFIVLGELVFCIVFGRHLIGNMAGYNCAEFIKSGQLRDFEFQMQERLKILHDPEIMNVVLPEMNNEQGPFMHMPLVADPNAYTNRATARFYGKESVIAIPRPEYYELYGYPEEEKE